MTQNNSAIEINAFVQSLIEQTGGILEWEYGQNQGIAVTPTAVATALGQTQDTFSVGPGVGREGLATILGSEFIEVVERTLLQFVPMVGGFALPDCSVKKTEFSEMIERTFAWNNARSKIRNCCPILVPYHAWWILASLSSEDSWETLVSVTLNTQTQIALPIPDLTQTPGLCSAKSLSTAPEATLGAAIKSAEVEMMRLAEDFIRRIDSRHERDRKRLKDYYSALIREAKTPNRRTKSIPSPEELETKTTAVQLELTRKLAEQKERYAIQAILKPVALAEITLPAVAIDIQIQRKAAVRDFRIYWNSVLRRLEPLACSQCDRATYQLWFANDSVNPLCKTCFEK